MYGEWAALIYCSSQYRAHPQSADVIAGVGEVALALRERVERLLGRGGIGACYPSRRTREEEGQKQVIALPTTALTFISLNYCYSKRSHASLPVSKSSGMEMGMREGEG